MKNKKVLLISTLVVALGGWMIYKKIKSNKNKSVPETTDTVLFDLENMSIPDKDLVLSLGARGREVELLQIALKNLIPDGIFGMLTLARLKAVTGKNEITLNQYNDFVTKQTDVNFIIGAKKHNNSKTLFSFDADFLKAWVDGIKAVESTFSYNDKTYRTQGGTAV